MADIRSFTGYLTSDLVGAQNMTAAQTFTIPGTAPLNVLFTDDDRNAEGDPGGEVANDAGGNQIAFIETSTGTTLVDGSAFYLELTFTFQVNGQLFTGYQFEIEGTGEDFVILPPGVPAGSATVLARDFTPSPDLVDYDALSSGSETVDGSQFTNLDTSGNDEIRAGSGDDTILAGGGADTISGNSGNDDLSGDAGADQIYGGGGDDIISGGAGNDTIYGDGDASTFVSQRLSFNWSTLDDPSGDGTAIDPGDDVSTGISQDTGGITVTTSFVDQGNGNGLTFSTSAQQTAGINAGGGTVNTTSSGNLGGTGGIGDTATMLIDFASNDPLLSSEVENIQFRVNDLDESGWRDTVTIRAYDLSGNLLPVDLTGGANHTLSDTDAVPGNDTLEVNEGGGNGDSTTLENSLLVEIPGPVSHIEIDYGNLDTGGQIIEFTDIYFDTRSTDQDFGNDNIDGGTGDDFIDAGAGADTLSGGDGADTLQGGDGDDLLTINDGDSAAGGVGADTFVVGTQANASTTITDFDPTTNVGTGTYDQGDNDFVDLSGYFANFSELSAANLSAPGDDVVLDLGNGQTLTFTGVTDVSQLVTENVNVVCFSAGTEILTPSGPRRIETLRVNDYVSPLSGTAARIRWIGHRTLSAGMLAAAPRLCPIEIPAGRIGNKAPLIVSPQHRMLVDGTRAEQLTGRSEVFVKAKDLAGAGLARRLSPRKTSYFHVLLDQHDVLIAGGARAESLHLGEQALGAMDLQQRAEIADIFPDLTAGDPRLSLARHSITGKAARRLLAA